MNTYLYENENNQCKGMKPTTPGDNHDHDNEHEPVHKHETKEGEEPDGHEGHSHDHEGDKVCD